MKLDWPAVGSEWVDSSGCSAIVTGTHDLPLGVQVGFRVKSMGGPTYMLAKEFRERFTPAPTAATTDAAAD